MNSNTQPLVSVVMPIRNEANFIERSLGAVLAQDYPAEKLELLVVDGMSDDGTRDVVRRLLADRPNAQLLDNPERLVTPAINIGIKNMHGEVMVLVGGHTVVASDYVRQCVWALVETGADCAGGVVDTVGKH